MGIVCICGCYVDQLVSVAVFRRTISHHCSFSRSLVELAADACDVDTNNVIDVVVGDARRLTHCLCLTTYRRIGNSEGRATGVYIRV